MPDDVVAAGASAPGPTPTVARRRAATVRHVADLRAQPPNHLAAALLLERALGPGPRPLDAVSRAGAVLVLRAPSAGWLPLLERGLAALVRRHRVDGRPDDEGDGWEGGREEELLELPRTSIRSARHGPFGPAPSPGAPGGRTRTGGFTPPLVVAAGEERWTPEARHRIARAWRTGQGVLLLLPPEAPPVPEELAALAGPSRTVPFPDVPLLEEVAVLLGGARAAPGTAAWRRARRRLGEAGLPARLAALGPDDLFAAHRDGEDGGPFLRRIAGLARRRAAAATTAGARLEELHGYGAARDWGLRLAADLQAHARGELPWAALDRGAVLAGPPGTGKTVFAAALARSAGVGFVAASLAQWQGAREGHLGTTLAAMQSSFARARDLAPCVLLVDELDSLGDRARFHEQHRDYSTQVVNALLELLDGATPREGVVVLGATNDPGRLDPALLRPGRLDRVIHVPLPDAAGLAGILRHHLGADLPDADLPAGALHGLAVTAQGRGASGADVAGWVRGARARARHAGRALAWDDLVAEVGPTAPPLSPDELRRVCVHEAGHAIGYLLLDRSRALVRAVRVPLGPVAAGDGPPPAATEVDQDAAFWRSTRVTPRRLRRQLRALLAGRAAETAILGEPSAGAGITRDSDLATATRLATLACASWGLDGRDVPRPWRAVPDDPARLLAADPELRVAVGSLLQGATRDALRMATRCRQAITRIADALAERGQLNGEEIQDLVRGTTPARPCSRRIERPACQEDLAGGEGRVVAHARPAPRWE